MILPVKVGELPESVRFEMASERLAAPARVLRVKFVPVMELSAEREVLLRVMAVAVVA